MRGLPGSAADAVLIEIDVGARPQRDGEAGEVGHRAAAQQHADAIGSKPTISFSHSIT